MFQQTAFFLVIVLFFVVIQESVVFSQQLEAHLARARLPSPRSGLAAIYDNDDSVYLFGGSFDTPTTPVVRYDSILKYSISEDSIENVGTLPVRTSLGSTAINGKGEIFHIGGYFNLKSIYKFDPVTKSVELVANLTEPAQWAVARTYNSSIAYVFGTTYATNAENGIHKFDMDRMTTEKVGDIEYKGYYRLSGAAFDSNIDQFHIFICCSNITNFDPKTGEQTQILAEGGFYTQAATQAQTWDGQVSYFVGDYVGNFAQGLGIYDTLTNVASLVPVKNFPGGVGDNILMSTAAVYVEKLRRIYFFGGKIDSWTNGDTFLDGIYYINLDGESEATSTTIASTMTTMTTITTTIGSTSIPTSTGSPVLIDCSNKTDGMYPHPQDCSKFFGCLSGEGTEFQCPQPLLFDPITLTCTVPEAVVCEINCADKEDGLYPHPHDCSLFLTCQNGLTHVYKCPEPLLFDPIEFRCNFPNLVDCSFDK